MACFSGKTREGPVEVGRDKVTGKKGRRKEALRLHGLCQESSMMPVSRCHSGWLRAVEVKPLGFGFGSAVAM